MTSLAITACDIKVVGELATGTDASSSGVDSDPSVTGGPGSGVDSDPTGTDGRTSGNATDPTATDTSPTGSATATDGTESSDTGTDTGTCPPDGQSICDPQPDSPPPDTDFALDDAALTELQDMRLCMVAAVDPTDSGFRVDLDCGETPDFSHTVELPSLAQLPDLLPVGSIVRLNVQHDNPFWSEVWFSITDEAGDLIVGGASGSRLLPVEPGQPPTQFFDGFVLEVADDLCPVECALPDSCAAQRRLGVQITRDAVTTTVMDGTSTVLGDPAPYEVRVGTATQYIEPDPPLCTDIPGTWFEILIVAASG